MMMKRKFILLFITIIAIFLTVISLMINIGNGEEVIYYLYDDMWDMVEIDVYVNNIKIQTPVYENKLAFKSDPPKNLDNYVLLKPVCEALGATVKETKKAIFVKVENKYYKILKLHIAYKNDDIYIQLSTMRSAIDGSLTQNDPTKMYLFSSGYERLDIPGTMEDCYVFLDEMLDIEIKEDIRNSNNAELSKYHLGLGLWIRNNWLRQTDGRITKELRKAGYGHYDDMSAEILEKYQSYLKGKTED